jgi:hypothetical protein
MRGQASGVMTSDWSACWVAVSHHKESQVVEEGWLLLETERVHVDGALLFDARRSAQIQSGLLGVIAVGTLLSFLADLQANLCFGSDVPVYLFVSPATLMKIARPLNHDSLLVGTCQAGR